jgi:hypothetical protein
MNEAAALPSPPVLLSGRLKRYCGHLRRPPGTRPLPGADRLWGATLRWLRRPPGRGGPPQFPPPPSRRSTPHTPGGSSGLRFQALHPFRGLHRDTRGSAPPVTVQGRASNPRQASRDAADRRVASPNGAFDAGLRPGPFPDRAASLLPSLLVTTRTGLSPAGDDGLMLISSHRTTSNSGRATNRG